jgi:ATP-dependent DNA helicase RecG
LEKQASSPYNPDIANALFRSGYIEAWDRGTIKIINECRQAGIPEPLFSYDSSNISVEFRKDIYNEKYLKSLNLNESQIKAVLYLKKKGKINNSDYQNLNNVSRETATRDLKQLNNKQLIRPSGQKRSRCILYTYLNCVIIAS